MLEVKTSRMAWSESRPRRARPIRADPRVREVRHGHGRIAIITKSWASPATPRPRRSRRRIATSARKHHPDVNPGDKKAEAKFKEAQQAYDILSDAEKRALYDRYGRAALRGDGGRRPEAGRRRSGPQRRRAGPGFESFDFSEFFGPAGPAARGGAGGPRSGAAGSSRS